MITMSLDQDTSSKEENPFGFPYILMYADDTTIFGKSDFLIVLDKTTVQATDHIVNSFNINIGI